MRSIENKKVQDSRIKYRAAGDADINVAKGDQEVFSYRTPKFAAGLFGEGCRLGKDT